MQLNRQHSSAVFDETCISESPVEFLLGELVLNIEGDEADLLYLSEYAWQAAVTGSGDQSVQYLYFFFFYLPLQSPSQPLLYGMCATMAAGTSVDRTSS